MASFSSVGLCAGGGSGKTIGLMLGHWIGDSTGGIFWVGSGFSGVFGLVSISMVLIFRGLSASFVDCSFFCNMFQNSFSIGSDNSGAVW